MNNPFTPDDIAIIHRALRVLQYASDDALEAVPARLFVGGTAPTDNAIESILEKLPLAPSQPVTLIIPASAQPI
jgi:hypothetical protein